jgi:iron complex transport system ATP-binding protein
MMIARALAQDTDLILLDEPTAHLDLPNRVEIIRLLRSLARETGKGFLLSTHELDLALKAGDKAWLLNSNKQLFTGVPEDLVLDGTFESVFRRDSFDFDRATGSFNLHIHNGNSIGVKGDSVGRFWTQRALKREGWQIADPEQADQTVIVQQIDGEFKWVIEHSSESEHAHSSIDSLIRAIRNSIKY